MRSKKGIQRLKDAGFPFVSVPLYILLVVKSSKELMEGLPFCQTIELLSQFPNTSDGLLGSLMVTEGGEAEEIPAFWPKPARGYPPPGPYPADNQSNPRIPGRRDI